MVEDEVGNPGFQTAEISHVEKDQDPGLTGLIEFMDDLWILEVRAPLGLEMGQISELKQSLDYTDVFWICFKLT